MKIFIEKKSKIHFSAFYSDGFESKNEVHIHIIDSKNVKESSLEKMYFLLNEDEKARANKFRFEKDKREFVVGRRALKTLLSQYLSSNSERYSVDPSVIQLEKGTFGKPKLGAQPTFENPIQFNVSHSNGLIVIAFQKSDFEIGIDIEKIKQPFDYQGIVDNFFTKKEQLYIRSEIDFFELWTRKEALLKITGVGLTNDLTHIDISENGVISDLNDERFLPFLNNNYYMISFRFEDYWISLATELDASLKIFDGSNSLQKCRG